MRFVIYKNTHKEHFYGDLIGLNAEIQGSYIVDDDGKVLGQLVDQGDNFMDMFNKYMKLKEQEWVEKMTEIAKRVYKQNQGRY